MNFIDGGLSMKVTYSLPVAVSSKFGEAYKGKRAKSILAKTVVYLSDHWKFSTNKIERFNFFLLNLDLSWKLMR